MISRRPHLRVLCISRDQRLLETRQLVLITRYQATCVHNPEEIQDIPEHEAFDVLLLCHTLSQEECQRSADIARKRWPAIKVVAIWLGWPKSLEFADVPVSATEGPNSLFEAIERAAGVAA